MVNLDLAGAADAVRPDADTKNHADSVAAHRFPKPRFPTTVVTVPVLLLVVTMIAAGALALLRSPAIPGIPAPASGELRAAANDAAAAFAGPVDQVVRSVDVERSGLAVGKGKRSLRRIAQTSAAVAGLVLVDRVRNTVVADRGDDVPIPPALPNPGDGPQSMLTDDSLVVSVPVSAERVLVGSIELRAPHLAAADQRVLLVRPGGAIVAQSSGTPGAPPTVVQAVADSVARGQPGFAIDSSRLVPGTGVLAIPPARSEPTDRVAAVGGAAVPGVAGAAGVQALVVRSVPLVPGAPTSPGWVAAGLVAAGGLLGFGLLRLLLVRPIRRLHNDVDRLVDDIDSGREATGWIRRSWLRETDRVGRFAARLPLAASGTRDMAPSPRYRFTIGGALLLVTVGALLIAVLASGFAAVHSRQSARTDVLVERSRATVEDTAEKVERTLTEGLAAVQASASPTVGEIDSDWSTKVSDVRVSRPAFRAVYVRDAAGAVVAATGDQPRADRIPTAPIQQLNQSGPEPVVTAAAPTHDGRFTVVAEFDPHALNATLRQADRPTKVFDGRASTVLGSDGYVSFSPLDEPVLHRAVDEAATAPKAAVETVGGNDELVATQRIGQSDATAALGWVVLQDREVTTARYTVDPVGRATTVIIALTALVCMGLLAWGYVTTVQPLHRLVDWIGSAGSDAPGRPVAQCPPPRRLDEVGAVMAGLNHCMKRE